MMMLGLVIFKVVIIFLLGLIFGSFAGVIIQRGLKGKSIQGRSHCDHCQKQLSWYDNIPLFSYFILKGKCRNCQKKISWQYPTIELMLAIIFNVVAWRTGFSSGFLDKNEIIITSYYLAVSFVLLIILVWDLKAMIIPDGLVVGGLILAVIFHSYRYWISADFLWNINSELTSNILGGIIIFLFFYGMFIVSQGRWIGGGDVKLGFLLGFLVGWRWVYLLLLLAYILGALPAIYLLVTKKATPKTQIPFGPFLIIATFIVIFFGNDIVKLWFSLFF